MLRCCVLHYAESDATIVQINEVLEASLGQLQARNHPHAEAVAAALNRTGSTERRGGLLLSPTSPLRQKAVANAFASRGGASGGAAVSAARLCIACLWK